MVELHGWITIRKNFVASDEDNNIEQIATYLSQSIEKMGIDSKLFQFNYNNGESFVNVTKFTNHFSEDIQKIIEFFRQAALAAPGSYGLLYLHNDEDRDGFDNVFQVFVLSKGNFTLQEDTFLSPYIPMVEEQD